MQHSLVGVQWCAGAGATSVNSLRLSEAGDTWGARACTTSVAAVGGLNLCGERTGPHGTLFAPLTRYASQRSSRQIGQRATRVAPASGWVARHGLVMGAFLPS